MRGRLSSGRRLPNPGVGSPRGRAGIVRPDESAARAERAVYDRAEIDAILDEGLVCHLGFVHDGQPFVIPTLYARLGDDALEPATTCRSSQFRPAPVTRASLAGGYRCSQWQHHLKEAQMFTELSEELLDLAVHVDGYRNALYARLGDPGSGCSSCTGSSSSLTSCKLSW